jgi:hypothetical protein
MPGINGHLPQAYHNGSWKNWSEVKGKFDGDWQNASDVYVKEDGEWKQVWVRLTAPTSGSSSVSGLTATISWTAGVGQEGFKLYRNGVFVKNVAANATSTTDTLPAYNTNFTYTVSAFAGATETAQISCGVVSAPLTAPPSGSTSLSDVTATISWTAGVGQEGFRIYRGGSLIGTAAANATTFNNVLPALQTTYTYTVSAFAGATETAQTSAGTARAEVGGTTSYASIATDWGYANDTWNNNQITFNTSCDAVSNATGYQASYDSGATVAFTGGNSTSFGLNQDGAVNIKWRAYRTYNSVNYFGAFSSNTKTVNAGRPLIRNAAENVNYNKQVYRGQTVGETVDFGAFGTVVDSYIFRAVDAVGSSLLANDTRRVIFRRPSGAGGDISIPFGASNVSGTGDDSGTYSQGPFTNYVAGQYAVSAISASSGVGGWSASSTPYISYQLRFVVRSIQQVNVAYSIT